MEKFSGGYIPINPNFVIGSLKNNKSIDHEQNGIISNAKNILFRGCPTFPSVFLESKLGEIAKYGGFLYYSIFNELKWEQTIKGFYSKEFVRLKKSVLEENKNV